MVLPDQTVSVIIPVFNGEQFISDALFSILRQTHRPDEIIVIDDGSTDATASVVKQFGKQVIYRLQDNKGPAAARNHGIKISSGSMIAFLDSDDLWPLHKLEEQLTLLLEHPTTEALIGNAQSIDVHSEIALAESLDHQQSDFVLWSGLFRSTCFGRVGLFNESYLYCEDWDWLFRARESKIRMMHRPNVWYFYRHREGSMTENRERVNHYLLKMFRQSLERRRLLNNGNAELLSDLDASDTQLGHNSSTHVSTEKKHE